MNSNQSLKIIFAGTPEFAAVSLQALLTSKHQVIAVYTQPDRPAGRGRQLTASAVKQLAEQYQLPIYQPLSLRQPEEQIFLKNLQADIMIVVAYGLILPLPILQAPRFGCLNVHASLLPRWRGAAPIQRAILAGDTETGVTIMQMDEGLDTGNMLCKKICPIQVTDTSQILHTTLATLGAEALLHTLDELAAGTLSAEKQSVEGVTYAHKITKEEAVIDWNQSAAEIDQKIRAFFPWPIAQTTLDGEIMRIWEAKKISDELCSERPGEILKISPEGIDVATGEGVLRLLTLQLPGGRALPVVEMLNSNKRNFTIGHQFG